MQRNHRIFIPIFLIVTACATVTAESEQAISVTTTPAGAHCELRNGEGSWNIVETPGNAMVRRAFSPLHIRCEKAGVGSADRIIEAKTRQRAYGNILLLGYPALVDAATGAGYEYESHEVTLELSKKK